ncbi:SDR family oxidoreductase [Komarekiella sp. 'clone 1']|uniref:SDR family oxidoreductase n=1 Tax=Komarekiella delphini-convector SJRDD-AB1 TaxID=2593771 RepID=A0AA40STN1_9NOST|nr:SDR family oxidoreductase [Komarekiella delphini-convector]MBD6614844.1 SDR family oxidoreductase [Komarekiella delphini-convector SJRDD-AB1]
MDLGFSGKVAVITGGDSGIGKATAQLLVREGAEVAIIDKTSEALEQAAKEIGFGEVFAVQADLTKLEEVEAAKRQIIERFQKVHILVNAAGITGATADFLELSDEDWYETIEVDLMAAVRICRAFIPLMREAGWGRVVLISSEDAVQPYPEEVPYCACKAAVLNLAKNLSKAYAKDGVLVNTVSPAYIASPMTDAMMKKRSQQLGINFDEAIATFLDEQRPHIELKRRGKPEEVAAVIAFLCSEQSSFVVGSNYRVDGGSVASL